MQAISAATRMITKPNIDPEFSKGTLTFIPQKLAIIVGIAKIMVMDVSNFMVVERLLEIMDEKASVVDLVILP